MIEWSRASRPFEEDMCFLGTLSQWSKVVESIHAFQVGALCNVTVTCCDLLHAVGFVGWTAVGVSMSFSPRLLGAVLAAFLFSKVRPTDFGVPMSAANLQEQLRLGCQGNDVESRL